MFSSPFNFQDNRVKDKILVDSKEHLEYRLSSVLPLALDSEILAKIFRPHSRKPSVDELPSKRRDKDLCGLVDGGCAGQFEKSYAGDEFTILAVGVDV
jgi:hypothetical protein